MDNQANQQKQPSYAFCIYCGKKYVVGDKFCQNCGKKIEIAAPPSPEEMKKRQYDQAVALFNAHRYDEAQKIFTQLADYNDSKDKAQECVTAKENAAKEQVYVSCIAYLTKPKISEAELKSAIERLKAIESYKDSKDKIAGLEKRLNMWYEAKKAAEQAALKKQYDTALAHLNSGLFDKAVAEFTALGDYSDAKAQIKNCYAAKENARKAQLYSSAVAVITAQNATEDMIKASIESLKSIPDFKDSKDKIKEVEARLEKFYADKALAKKKKRRRTAISLVIVFLLALIAGAIIFATTPFVITYNLDGGSIDPKISRSYTLLTDDYALPTPTKDGYIFKGWTGTGLSSPTQDVTIKRFSFGNRSYTANWEAGKYTVQFYVNGGTGVYNAKTLAYGDTFNIPEPTREGYAFMGWASPTAVYNNGDTWLETENVSLAAMWSANQYTITFEDIYAIADDITVTFDLNYFMSDASIHTLNNGDRINYPNTPVRAGYLFTGWYLDSNCTNEYAFQGNITGDMTLYAGWKQVSATNDYYYPWSFSGNVITSTNHSHSSTSEYTITVSEDTTVSFQYKVSSESGCDVFRIMKNGVDIITASGNSYDTYTDFSVDLVAGDTLTFRYSKDGSANNGTDTAYICNLSTATKYESTAVVRNENVYSYEYRLGETATMTVTYGEEFILPDPARRGYSLLNWRCNGTVIESGIWNMTYDITLTPEWEMGRNVITLNPDGGTVANTTVTVRFEQSYTLPTPTKTGYTFLGWYMGNTKYEGGVWRGLDNITLTARWSANNYTVTFDDTDEMTSNVVVTLNYNYSGATNSTVTLTNGQTLSYPTPPTRSGYAFAGWYTNSSCTTQYSFSGTITQNMTLYAKWTSMASSYYSREYVNIASYTTSSSKKSVTINASSSSSQNYYYFTCYKSGSYTIYTAYSSGDFYVEVYNVTRGTTIMSRTNLYSSRPSASASFSANAGDVIYVRLYKYSSSGSTGYGTFYVTGAGYPTSTATANNGVVDGYVYDASSTATKTVAFGSALTLPTPTREGYTFLGWYNGNAKVESGTWTTASNVTLTPRWEANSNTLSFNPDGGTVNTPTMTVTYDQSYTLPTPTRTGYTFQGWYSGETPVSSGTWQGTSNLTLVARWSVNTYTVTFDDSAEIYSNVTVTFDYNYTGSTPYNVTLVNGQTLSYPNIPTRSGYVFAGWYTNSTCTTQYTFSGTITSNMTLYAKWVTNSKSNTINVGTSTSVYISGQTIRYYAFVPLVSGTITVYSTGSYDSYGYLFNSSLSTLTSNDDGGSNTNFSYSYNVTAGTLYYIGVRAYSSAVGNITVYVNGTQKPSSTATASCAAVNAFTYDPSSYVTQDITYGSIVSLPVPIRTGYTFLGWYNGETKVESGVWSIASDVTLTPRWQ